MSNSSPSGHTENNIVNLEDRTSNITINMEMEGNGVVDDETDDTNPTNSAMQRHLRTWRMWRSMNLNDVLTVPSTASLRSLISHSGNFRYTPLPTTTTMQHMADGGSVSNRRESTNPEIIPRVNTAEYSRINGRSTRSNSLREAATAPILQTSLSAPMGVSSVAENNYASNGGGGLRDSLFSANLRSENSMPGSRLNSAGNRTQPSQAEEADPNAAGEEAGGDIDEENMVSEIFIKFLRHFVRYLPFICILLVKFVHDHLLGLLDLIFLHIIMYQVNKALREQVAKLAQKSLGVLMRYCILVIVVVFYRFMLASSMPDPLGLLISPSTDSVTLELSSLKNQGATVNFNVDQSSTVSELSKYFSQISAKIQPTVPDASMPPFNDDKTENTVTITNAISLSVLLYYVAVNDLILKLLTMLVKLSITMIPTTVIRFKPRARLYVLVEYLSQFYRSLAPVRQWLMFLFESYTGLEVISGVLFSSFYLGAKVFEFIERGKSLKKAVINFWRNMDYERKPTNEELNDAGTLCPICHDNYKTPVILECGHIFCDDCVQTWFKRDQTCPMCRAKVSEDPTWQDGSTTFFYQLC